MNVKWIVMGLSLLVASNAMANKTAVKKQLEQMIPGGIQVQVLDSPVSGFYMVDLGAQVVMVSEDGKYLVDGDVVDLNNRANLIEQYMNKKRIDLMASHTDEDYIEFKAEQEKKVLKVFTDVDCPYCHKFHQQVPQLNEAGVTIQYYAYPRAPKGTPTYKKAEGVWCSTDRKIALASAKQGASIEYKRCESVDKQQALGAAVGVTGTPSLVFENGQLVPGYVSTKKLLEYIY